MNTASATETATNPTWSTTAVTGATQSWTTTSSYDPYYSYYQSVPPPTTTTSTANYQQDYSQAWDEYYKAYYGQSYASTTTQYPTNYSYDQYGYANLSAPPPNYYETAPQTSTYEYTQPAPAVSSAPFPVYNTAPSNSLPPTTNWSEPPPNFSQPPTYNTAQTYEQPQSYNQPPPLPTSYDNFADQNNMMQPPAMQQPGNYGDQFANNQQKFNPKMFDYGSDNNNMTLNQQPANNPQSKETSYLEQYPPPSFGSPVKQGNRGRGFGNFNNQRGRQMNQGPRNNNMNSNNNNSNNNFNQNRNQNFNRGGFGNRNNNDRRQFNNNDFNDEGPIFANKQNNMNANNAGNNNMKRGNWGGFNSNRGRNFDGSNFQPRNMGQQWQSPSDMNEFAPNDFDEPEYCEPINEMQNQDFDNSSFSDWDNKPIQRNQDFDDHNFNSHIPDETNQRCNIEAPKPNPNMGVSHSKSGFNNLEIPPLMSLPVARNGGMNVNNRVPMRNQNMDRNMKPMHQTNQRQSMQRFNNAPARPQIKLMDVVVHLSPQSPVIKRRQHMLDQWQSEIRDMHNRRIPINCYWSALKLSLPSEFRDAFTAACYKQSGLFISELMLDDVFLIQNRADTEEISLDNALKALFDMLKNRMYVITASRELDGEKVPGFCISSNQHGSVNLPPMCKLSDRVSNSNISAIPFKNDLEVDQFKSDPVVQICDSGLFVVIEVSTNERDQSITSLVATARFNNSVIEYQHEKLPHAPHISSCVITIDGVEVERHEARDYLVAKRQAADKVMAKLKQTRPQITLRFDKAKLVKKDDIHKEESFENSAVKYLQNFSSSNEDIPLKFDSDFASEDKTQLITAAVNLNLSHKSEGKNVLFIFKQFPILEMKTRLLNQGFCGQYQLLEKGSDHNSFNKVQ